MAGSLRAVMTALRHSRQPQNGSEQGSPSAANGLLWNPLQLASQTSCLPLSTRRTSATGTGSCKEAGALRAMASSSGVKMRGSSADVSASFKPSATACSCRWRSDGRSA